MGILQLKKSTITVTLLIVAVVVAALVFHGGTKHKSSQTAVPCKKEYLEQPESSSTQFTNLANNCSEILYAKYIRPDHYVGRTPVTKEGLVLQQLPPKEPGWAVVMPPRLT